MASWSAKFNLEAGIRVDYAITRLGRSLFEHILPVWDWSADNAGRLIAAQEAYDDLGAGMKTNGLNSLDRNCAGSGMRSTFI